MSCDFQRSLPVESQRVKVTETGYWGTITLPRLVKGARNMKDKELIAMWNEKRNQIILSQLAPTIVLTAGFILASLGTFTMASHQAKYFSLGVIAVTGILAAISNLGVIRESEAITQDLKNESGLSAVGKKISESRELVILNIVLNFVMSVGIFALAALAILK